MKIICVHGNYARQEGNKAGEMPFQLTRPVVSVKPDSSLLKGGKPFFIPAFSNDIRCGASLVMRICRLGKCIASRFAPRYYDAVTVGVSFHAHDLLSEACSKGEPTSLYDGFDGAAVIGNFVSIEALCRQADGISFSLLRNESEVQQGEEAGLSAGFNELVAYISNYYTLKMGDLIFAGFPSEDIQVDIGDKLSGFIGTQRVLQFNIR